MVLFPSQFLLSPFTLRHCSDRCDDNFSGEKICVNTKVFFTRMKGSDRCVVKFFFIGVKKFSAGPGEKSSDRGGENLSPR